MILREKIMNKEKSKKIVYILLMLLSVAAFGTLMYMVPYLHDDWAWGGKVGLERLDSMFAAYNGRYLGNFLVLAISRSTILKTILMTVITLSIPFFAYKYVNRNFCLLYFVGFCLLFFMPSEMFRQTIGWVSGFSNYVPPIVASIFYLYIVRNIFEEEKPQYSKTAPVIVFFTGVFGALFMEHVTLFNIALAALVIFYTAVRFKKLYVTHISFALGAAAGAVIMFTNSAYGIISSGEDFYRETASGTTGYISLAVENARKIYKYLVEDNIGINIVICILLLIIVLLTLRKNQLTTARRRSAIVCSVTNVAYVVFDVMVKIYPRWSLSFDANGVKTDIVKGLFALLYTATLIFIPMLCIDNLNRAIKVCSPILFNYILTAPLFVVSPISSRCFLPCYAFLIVYVCGLINEILDVTQSKKTDAEKMIVIITSASILACLLFYGNIYNEIYKFDAERLSYINEQIDSGSTKVKIPRYRYDVAEYVLYSTPKNDSMWEDRFKDFYGIDENIDLEPIDYSEYAKLKENP